MWCWVIWLWNFLRIFSNDIMLQCKNCALHKFSVDVPLSLRLFLTSSFWYNFWAVLLLFFLYVMHIRRTFVCGYFLWYSSRILSRWLHSLFFYGLLCVFICIEVQCILILIMIIPVTIISIINFQFRTYNNSGNVQGRSVHSLQRSECVVVCITD